MKNMLKSFGTLIASVTMLATACSGSTESGSSGAAPIAEDQLLEAYVAAMCDNIGPCCQEANYGYDPAACRTLLSNDVADDDFPKSGPTIIYNASAAGECIAAVAKRSKSCDAEGDLEICDEVFVGTIAPGEPCTSTMECSKAGAQSVECERDDSGHGTCTVSVRGKLSDPCYETCTESPGLLECSGGSSSAEGGTCYKNDGLYCDESSKCAALTEIGGACPSYGDGCLIGAYCESNTSTCMQRKAVGEACSGDRWDECMPDLNCVGGSCILPQPAGAACENGNECESYECEGGVCTKDTFVDEEVCTGVQTDSTG